MGILRILKTVYLKAKLKNDAIIVKKYDDLASDIDIRVAGKGTVEIKDLKTDKRVSLTAIDGTLSIGESVYLNRNNTIVCRKSIVIGNNCSFGPNVVVYDHDHKFSKEGFDNYQFNAEQVVIEDGVWLGAGVIILKGSHIGHHSVIGAGTIVNTSIPPHSIVMNNRKLRIKPIEDRG